MGTRMPNQRKTRDTTWRRSKTLIISFVWRITVRAMLHWAGSGGHRLLTLLDWTDNFGKIGTDAHGKVEFAHTGD